MSNVLVVAEYDEGKLDSLTFELIAKGKELAGKLGQKLDVLLVGAGCGQIAEELAGKGPDSVLVVDNAVLGQYLPETHTKAISEAVRQVQPSLVLFGHTYRGIEVAPAVATVLGATFVSNCIDLESRDGAVVATRPLYESKMQTKAQLTGPAPWIVTVQKGAFAAGNAAGARVAIVPLTVALAGSDIKTRPIEIVKPQEGKFDISKANIIVSVGRGIKGKENVKIAEELAAALGGVVACSRPVADIGWLPPECHVGMSGKTVSPKVYLAFGISGASQHITGIRDSKLIIAINNDPNAPIFRVAHYGVANDMFKVMPALIQEAKSGG